MSSINTGGSAFPLHSEIRPTLDKEWCGMTLRDYFAAKAMQGLLAQSVGAAFGIDPKFGAEYAYAMADAMLKAREA
jgi:hypothetical protein